MRRSTNKIARIKTGSKIQLDEDLDYMLPHTEIIMLEANQRLDPV